MPLKEAHDDRAHLDPLTERLDQLERETRRLNRGLLALLVLIATAMDALFRLAALQIWDQVVGLGAVAVAVAAIDYHRLGKRRPRGTQEGAQ